MVELRVITLACSNLDLEIAKFRCRALENYVSLSASLFRISLCLEVARACQGMVPDDRGLQVGRCIGTWRAFDSCTPTSTVLPPGELYEFGRDVNVVRGIMDGLATAGAYIVFIPAVAIKLVLLAGVSEGCIGKSALLQRLMEPIRNASCPE